MAVIEANKSESKTGYKKRLDSNAEEVLLNIVQVSLYTYPFKSMVRELASNALDSIREKNMALNIISGREKVSDYYVTLEGNLYEDSKFDRDYYNPSYLSRDNEVVIEYINREDQLRDLFVIEDTGVGLGGKRLEKFFTPGWSSKRLNVKALGSYGLGSKSPLATGVDFYTMISVYNGRKFAFDVYKDKVDSVYARFNKDGTENDYIEFDTLDLKGNQMRVYYEKTSQPNGVRIETEVKKHNKNQIIEAIKSQLMYFKENITAYDVTNNNKQNIGFKSKVLYEDENLLLSDSNYYARPHFVMKSVNYGLIDFKELDLDLRIGNIGIKVDMSEVDVHPSRESITYTAKTRTTILNKYATISQSIGAMIDKKLNTTDFLVWVKGVNSVKYGNSNNSLNDDDRVINTLANLIDKETIDSVFTISNGGKIKHMGHLPEMIGKYFNVQEVALVKNWNTSKIERKLNESVYNLNNPIVFQFDKAVPTVTNYILREHFKHYCSIGLKTGNEELDKVFKLVINKKITTTEGLNKGVLLIDQEFYKPDQAVVKKAYIKDLTKAMNFLQAVLDSKQPYLIYENIVVPEGYTVIENEAEVNDMKEEDLESIKKTNAARYKKIMDLRKANQSFIIKYFRSKYHYYDDKDPLVTTTVETKKTSLEGSHENLIYGTTEDREKIETLIKTLAKVKRNTSIDHVSNSTELGIIMISKDNVKNLPEGSIHVEDYGVNYDDNNNLTTIEDLKYYLRCTIVNDLCSNLTFDKESLKILYPTFHDFLVKYRSTKASLKDISSTDLKSIDLVITAFKAELKLLGSKDLDEVDIDDILCDHLHIDVVDSINGINIIGKDFYEQYLLAKDFINIFGTSINGFEMSRNKRLYDMLEAFVKTNKHKLSLEHINLNA